MGERGTVVSNIKSKEDHFDLMKSITGNDIFNLQDIVEKFKNGNVEKIAHNCYEKAFRKIETIESWRKGIKSKKFRSPKLENVLLIAQKTETDISELL